MISLSPLFFLLLSSYFCRGEDPASQFKVVAFLTDWSASNPQLAIKWAQITHLLYASVSATETGNLDTSKIDLGRLRNVSIQGRNRGVNVMISVNGAAAFSSLVRNPPTLELFVQQLLQFCQTNQLQGVDIDWEYPEADTSAGFVFLMKTLSETFAPRGYLLSADVAPNDLRGKWYPNDAFSYVNWINVRAYNFRGLWNMSDPGPHASFEESTNAIKYWLQTKKLPPPKVVFGLPFFGKDFSNVSGAEEVPFRKIIELHPQLLPSATRFGLLFFDGPELIENKAKFAMKGGLGGIMVWEYGQDTFPSSNRFSLLDTISSVVGSHPTKPLPAPSARNDGERELFRLKLMAFLALLFLCCS